MVYSKTKPGSDATTALCFCGSSTLVDTCAQICSCSPVLRAFFSFAYYAICSFVLFVCVLFSSNVQNSPSRFVFPWSFCGISFCFSRRSIFLFCCSIAKGIGVQRRQLIENVFRHCSASFSYLSFPFFLYTFLFVSGELGHFGVVRQQISL